MTCSSGDRYKPLCRLNTHSNRLRDTLRKQIECEESKNRLSNAVFYPFSFYVISVCGNAFINTIPFVDKPPLKKNIRFYPLIESNDIIYYRVEFLALRPILPPPPQFRSGSSSYPTCEVSVLC